MEINVGVQFAPRELHINTKASVEEIQKMVEEAFAGNGKLLWLLDESGKHVAIPLDKLAYVEVGSDKGSKSVGFTP